MPELPEVTTIVNQLKKEIVGSIISNVESFDGYRTTPEFSEFKRRSLGLKVLSVQRVAKTIVIGLGPETGTQETSTNLYIVIHLAMTGRLLLRTKESKPDPWLKLIFQLKVSTRGGSASGGESGELKELRFTDPRLFGYVVLMNGEEIKDHRAKYGPDPLDPKLSARQFLERLRLKRTGVKRALLEQDLVAGVGNIYANDGLWEAQIHPETLTTQVTSTQATRLLEALRGLLKESIEHHGSTLDDKMYLDLYGREGEHQNYFRIFGKAGKPCPRCQTPIEHKEIGGRQTYFCPSCQVRSTQETSTIETGTKEGIAQETSTKGKSTQERLL